ncbi:PAS domain-containing protein [bacterium]|nr:PAS domain-containing protein [bacterium]
MINLDSLLHNFLSSGINIPDRETIRKIKVLNIFQIVFVMTAPLLGLFYFYIGAIQLFYITIIAGLLMISAIILLRKTQDLTSAGNYAVFILWVTILVITWYAGPTTKEGIVKPFFMLDGGLILLAVFLNGSFWGAVWAAVALMKSCVIVYLFRAHYPFHNLIPAEMSEPYYFGVYLSAILILFVLSLLYEKSRNEVLTREDQKSHALEMSKRYLEITLERSPAPTFMLDRDHRVIAWNYACRMMTGVPSDKIIGKPVWKGFRIDDRASLADIILEDPDSIAENYSEAIVAQTDNGWFTLEMSLPKIKGADRVFISVNQILDNNGRVIGAIQIIEDDNAPQHDSGIMRSVDLEPSDGAVPNPLFKIDTEGVIRFWNAACEEIFGFPSSQMVGVSPVALLSKTHLPDFQKTVANVLEKDVSFKDKQWKFYTNDKKPIFVLAKAYPALSSEGTGTQCVILSTDITDLKVTVMNLERYAAESKEKLKNLSEEYGLLKKNVATFIRGKGEKKP